MKGKRKMTGSRLAKFIGMAIVLSYCGALAATEGAGEAPEAAATPTATLIVRGDRLFVPARVNGVETRDALLDSGAELSLVDADFARRAGLATAGTETARGTGGEEEVTFAQGVNLEAAGIVLEDRTVAVLDLGDIASRLVGSPLTMIVGRELFDAARLAIDIEGASLAAVPRDLEPAGRRLAMQTHKGLQTIPVAVEGGEPVQADFDLGNGSEVLIGATYAERAGLLAPGRITGQKSGGGIGGEVVRDLLVLQELEVAGVTFRDVPAAIDRTGNAADVNVGVRILRHFRITTDFAENAVWLEPR
jgi:predicted aspartyl protease